MKRLAIFDPANGKQPMSTSDQRHHIVFNGAIYNHQELRSLLEAEGCKFKTKCDTEVLLQAWVRWGEDALVRMRGMFAFAVWDRREERLVLVRDPLGIKPLYFTQSDGNLIFASELNSLRASRFFDAKVDPLAVDEYLRNLAVPAPRTLFKNANSLLPGEIAEWRSGRLSLRRYWRLPETKVARASNEEDFTLELRRKLEDSIAVHRLADVPVGAFLSGGLDSAVVAGLMSRGRPKPLKTFSIGFEEEMYSEAAFAAESAAHFGSDHHAIVLTGEAAAEKLPQFIASLDQPTGDGLNTFVVAEAARQGGVTVALSGLGGDELFGGYPQFKQTPLVARWLPWWRAIPRIMKAPVLNRLEHGSTRARRLADVLRNARDIHDIADYQRQVLSDPARNRLLAHPISPHRHATHEEIRESTKGMTAEEIVSVWEIKTYMSDVLLRDSDVFSMRASLELRVPLVDRVLVEWLVQQDPRLRFNPRRPKGALSNAVSDILPPGLLDRRKQGFTFPFPRWMRGPLKPFLEESLSREAINRTGVLNPTEVQRYWTKFINGSDDKDWSRVWSLAVLSAFINRA
ncbi:MAG: amidotransferase 1, exosortase A system-associated [Synoicihabitans sp.]